MSRYNVTEIIETILHDGLHRYKAKNSFAPLPVRVATEKVEKQTGYKKGVVFVTRTKEDLTKAKGFIVSSIEALEENKDKLSHWTPNVYRFGTYTNKKRKNIKGHEEQNLKQINCFVVDIDLKGKKHLVTREDILSICLDKGFLPTVLLNTPNGYQPIFVLEQPLYISNKNDFRGLKAAKRIAENLTNLLSEDLQGVDTNCNPFGFFRMPTTENVLHFSKDTTYTFAKLMAWSEGYDSDRNRSLFTVVKSNKKSDRQVDQEWFRTIITNRDITKGYELGRNNTVLTLSLACYQSGLTQAACYDLMDQFNTNLGNPLADREIRKTVKSAYSGKYQAAAPVYINKLMQIWGDGSEYKPSSYRVFKHVKKERAERQRSHYSEWEQDIVDYITSEIEYSETFIWRTQKELCEAVGVPERTLNKLINQSTKLIKTVVGKGRGAITGWTTVALYMKYVLFQLEELKGAYRQYVQSIAEDFLTLAQSPACSLLEKKINNLLIKLGLMHNDRHKQILNNTS